MTHDVPHAKRNVSALFIHVVRKFYSIFFI